MSSAKTFGIIMLILGLAFSLSGVLLIPGSMTFMPDKITPVANEMDFFDGGNYLSLQLEGGQIGNDMRITVKYRNNGEIPILLQVTLQTVTLIETHVTTPFSRDFEASNKFTLVVTLHTNVSKEILDVQIVKVDPHDMAPFVCCGGLIMIPIGIIIIVIGVTKIASKTKDIGSIPLGGSNKGVKTIDPLNDFDGPPRNQRLF